MFMEYFSSKKSKINFKSRQVRGFTLLETLVAISILTLSIAGAFTSAQSGLSSAILARDQIIAFQLGQEAVELVRNIRDNNTYLGNNWLEGLQSCINTDCFANVTNLSSPLGVCTSGCKVYKDNDGFYVQGGGGNPTGFTRIVRIEPVDLAKEVRVVVEMSWSKGLVNRTFEINEYMFNWQLGL